MTLEEIPAGARVFIDSTVFVCHFTGASAECRAFLERCERLEVRGATSVVVLAEVAHRLMMIEALARGLVSGGNPARKLRERPELVRQLETYGRQVERIPLMGVTVLPLGLKALLRSGEVRRRLGLLTKDSLVVAAAAEAGLDALAAAEESFARVPELRLYRPGDLAA